MLFWNQIAGIFNKKNKQKVKSLPIKEEEEEHHPTETETQTTSSTKVEPSLPVAPPLPEVEFEESRNLLQLDFFGSGQENVLASFPNFDYLLETNKKTPIDNNSTLKKPRKASTTLRHRISLYRPSHQKAVKRSLSTPDIYNSK